MWWILKQSLPVATVNSLTIRAFTSQADHLYTAWAYHEPRRHLIYRTVRGKTVLCGYKYIWDTPFITEQDRPGDTLYHTFRMTGLQLNSTIWYYLFAPDGPYGFEIQGPLRHITLPAPSYWEPNLFAATKLKGVFTTRTFSGPGYPQPNWIPINAGLHSLLCWQYSPDLLTPDVRHYLIAGAAGTRIVYRLDIPTWAWWTPFTPALFPDWVPLLTNADCLALTGWVAGEISWVATNINYPGHVYVLFHHAASFDGAACIRSLDHGVSWQAFPISPGVVAQLPGNIIAGHSRGSSGYPPGKILYAALNNTLAGDFRIYASSDLGQSWGLRGSAGFSAAAPRCMVEPTDQSIVYISALVGIPNPNELFRSQNHGAALAEVDGAHHLGFYLNSYWGQMWLDPSDINRLRVLILNHVWQTTDFCATWTDPGATPIVLARLSTNPHSPDFLYLGRRTNAPAWPNPHYPHVLFISTDEGLTLFGKCGDHADLPDGGGDSIPGDCGGLAHDGVLHPYPS